MEVQSQKKVQKKWEKGEKGAGDKPWKLWSSPHDVRRLQGLN